MKEPKVYINKKHVLIIVGLLILCLVVFIFSLPNYYQYGEETQTKIVAQQPTQHQTPTTSNMNNQTSNLTSGIDVFSSFYNSILVILVLGILFIFVISLFTVTREIMRR
jgi:ABC-type glycerol-3-phosphate transport system permease component